MHSAAQQLPASSRQREYKRREPEYSPLYGVLQTHLESFLAEQLVDHVVPPVPIRQWVFTVPPRLRYRMAYDHAVCTRVLQTFSRVLLTHYRKRARKLRTPRARTGAVTFIQRFGSALNLNIHFHTQVLDGVFTENRDGTLSFHLLPQPTNDDVRAVLEELVTRLRTILDDHDADADDTRTTDSPLLAACYAGSLTQRAAFGARAGRAPPRLVAFIPRPHKNLVVYHGVLAPNAKWRSRVTGYQRSVPSQPADAETCVPAHQGVPPRRNRDWARLMQRAFAIDVLLCPRCGDRMTRFAIPEGVRLIALIQSTHTARRILRHLGLRDHAPPVTPAPKTPLDLDHVA